MQNKTQPMSHQYRNNKHTLTSHELTMEINANQCHTIAHPLDNQYRANTQTRTKHIQQQHRYNKEKQHNTTNQPQIMNKYTNNHTPIKTNETTDNQSTTQ